MPTIAVDKDRFLQDLGRSFTPQEFDDLLFDYGLELDEDTSVTAPEEQPHKLKIEVPANRYDLLCHQGLTLALRTYIGTSPPPSFTVVPPPAGEEWTAIVRKETERIRPYFAAAILRGVHFDEARYKDFIDLQDKLHGNLCRRRTLVSMGTHDLDKMDHSKREISYEARPPTKISFAPLNKDKVYRADEMMTMYDSDKHLSKYLHIIRDSPVYPIIYDHSGTVLSMPPIINSDHTKITLDTRNIFFDVTATDQTKLQMVINILVTMFSQYCTKPFTVEPVRIVYEHSQASSYTAPDLTPVQFTARQARINAICGLNLASAESCALLRKMGHDASAVPNASAEAPASGVAVEQDDILVKVPATRPDILHECDLVEDVAVAYGFNRIKKTFPSTNTVAKGHAINQLSDIVRRECAQAGWLEVLPLTLCSHDENFAFLKRKDDGTSAVVLSNPATFEYQVVRTSLLPGMLKTIRENRKHPLPMKIFEVSDVVLKDDRQERRARNARRLCIVYTDRKAGFEVVHGLLDRILAMLGLRFLEASTSSGASANGYFLEQCEDATFLPGRAAKVMYRPKSKPVAPGSSAPASAGVGADGTVGDLPRPSHTHSGDQNVQSGPLETVKTALQAALPSTPGQRDIELGRLGILHPDVLRSFELDYPCSSLEIDISPLV